MNGRDPLHLFTAQELTEMFQVSSRWIYEQVRQGSLPAVMLGRNVRFRRSDVDLWLTSQLRSGADVEEPPTT